MDVICIGDFSGIWIGYVEEVYIQNECSIGNNYLTGYKYITTEISNMDKYGKDMGQSVIVFGGILDAGH